MKTEKEIREKIKNIEEFYPDGDIDLFEDGVVVETLFWVLDKPSPKKVRVLEK